MKNTKLEAMLIQMISMALTSMHIEHTVNVEDHTMFDFVDKVLGIQGTIGIAEDQALSIFVIDETYECPTKATIKQLEAKIVKPKAELYISGEDEHNVLLYYFDDVPLSEATTIASIQYVLMTAFLSAIKVRNLIENEGGIDNTLLFSETSKYRKQEEIR